MRQEEVKAAADKMLAMLDGLHAVEVAKQQLHAGSDEFVEVAEEAERLARVVKLWSEHQLELARAARRDRPVEGQPRLADVRPRQLDRILADWREAEMRLETAEPESPTARQAAAEVERLRAEYQAAAEGKRRQSG